MIPLHLPSLLTAKSMVGGVTETPQPPLFVAIEPCFILAAVAARVAATFAPPPGSPLRLGEGDVFPSPYASPPHSPQPEITTSDMTTTRVWHAALASLAFSAAAHSHNGGLPIAMLPLRLLAAGRARFPDADASTPGALRALLDVLHHAPLPFASIGVHRANFGDGGGALQLANALAAPHMANVRYLAITRCGALCSSAADALAQVLPCMAAMTRLDLSGNSLGRRPDALRHLAGVLRQLLRTRTLDLSHNHLTSTIVRRGVGNALMAMPALTVLRLHRNPIGIGVADLTWVLPRLRGVEVLDLSYCHLQDNCAKQLSLALGLMPMLVHADLGSNYIDAGGMNALTSSVGRTTLNGSRTGSRPASPLPRAVR
jgi:hypothetical protein